MHIVLAIEELNGIYGGVERTVINIANFLSGRRHRVTILTFEKNISPPYPLSPEVRLYPLGLLEKALEEKNVPRKRLKERLPGFLTGVIKNMLAVKRIFTVPRREVPALAEAFQIIEPDVVISFKTHFHRYVIPAASKENIPVIASEHNPPEILYYHYLSFIDRYVIRNCLKKAPAIRVLLEEFKNGYGKDIRNRITAIPNGIDIPPVAASPGDDEPPNIILNIGRLYFQKDQETLVRAFALIAGKHPGWLLEIYGDGDMEPRLKSLINELDLEDRACLKGVAEDVWPVYLKARIFALPSLFEGFGNVTLEAMACGLPVVAFDDVAANRELIDHQSTGLMVPADDRAENLARALETLIESPRQRTKMGENARRSAKRHEKCNILSRWEKLITETATQKHAP